MQKKDSTKEVQKKDDKGHHEDGLDATAAADPSAAGQPGEKGGSASHPANPENAATEAYPESSQAVPQTTRVPPGQEEVAAKDNTGEVETVLEEKIDATPEAPQEGTLSESQAPKQADQTASLAGADVKEATKNQFEPEIEVDQTASLAGADVKEATKNQFEPEIEVPETVATPHVQEEEAPDGADGTATPIEVIETVTEKEAAKSKKDQKKDDKKKDKKDKKDKDKDKTDDTDKAKGHKNKPEKRKAATVVSQDLGAMFKKKAK